jgi:actin-related protein
MTYPNTSEHPFHMSELIPSLQMESQLHTTLLLVCESYSHDSTYFLTPSNLISHHSKPFLTNSPITLTHFNQHHIATIWLMVSYFKIVSQWCSISFHFMDNLQHFNI